MTLKEDKALKYVLMSLSGILLLLSFFVIKDYFLTIVTSLVLAFILNPIYKHLMRIFRSQKFASILVCIFLVIILVGFSVFLINSLTNQAINSYMHVSKFLANSEISENAITTYIQETYGLDINIRQIIAGIISNIVRWGQNFIATLATRIVNFVIIIFSLFFLLNDKDKIKEGIVKILPISQELSNKILTEASNIFSALIFGHFVTGIVQGLVAGIGYVLLGVNSPLLWAFLSTFFAWIPLIGPPVIYIPLSVIMIISGIDTGTWYMGFILLGYGIFVISTIDNLLRPKLVGDRANVHPLVVFFGILGGVSVFGLVGLILGPLIIALFFFSMNMYANFLKEEEILQELKTEKNSSKRKKSKIVEILESSFSTNKK